MAMTIEDTINRQTYGPLGYLLSRQTFWVFIAAVVAFIYVSYASPSFLTPGNIFNVFRNFAFVGIIAPRHDGRHHHRRHRPFGRLGPLPDRHGRRHDDERRLLDLDRAARGAGRRGVHRRGQRRADRLCRHAALRGDARHDVARAQRRHGDVEQHHGVRFRPRPRQVHRPRRRLDARLVRAARGTGSAPTAGSARRLDWIGVHLAIPNPAIFLAGLRAALRLRVPLDEMGPAHLRDRRQRAGGDDDRRAGAQHQGQRLRAFGPGGRASPGSCRSAGSARSPPAWAPGWSSSSSPPSSSAAPT